MADGETTSDSVPFQCPNCGAEKSLRAALVGRQVRCGCGQLSWVLTEDGCAQHPDASQAGRATEPAQDHPPEAKSAVAPEPPQGDPHADQTIGTAHAPASRSKAAQPLETTGSAARQPVANEPVPVATTRPPPRPPKTPKATQATQPATRRAAVTPAQPQGTSRFLGAKVWEREPVLLDGLAANAEQLREFIAKAFLSREIPDSGIGFYSIRLRLRSRPYLIASWGRCRAYIYVTALGKDLYASWVGYYKMRLSLLLLLLLPLILVRSVRYGVTLDSFRKPPNEFDEEDISKFAAAVDHWACYAVDSFLQKAGWDQKRRQKRLSASGVTFSPTFKKA